MRAAASSVSVINLSEDIQPASTSNSTASIQLQNITENEFPQVLAYVVLENGLKVAEYYNEEEGINETSLHLSYSVAKSWISLLIGMLEGMGNVSLNETLIDIWPDESNQIWPQVNNSTYRQQITVEDLLTMTSGCDDPPVSYGMEALQEGIMGGTNLTEVLNYPQCLESNITNANDEFQYLNDNILSYIILERSGMPPQDFAAEYLMPFLGMDNGTWEWLQNLDGVAYASAGLSTTTMNYAKFGQLYLQNGFASESKQLVPRDWIERSTTGHIDISPDDPFRDLFRIDPNMTLSYGYRFWVFNDDDEKEEEEENLYCAFGAGGHYICVWPLLARVLSVNVAPANGTNNWLGYEFLDLVGGLQFASDERMDDEKDAEDLASSSSSSSSSASPAWEKSLSTFLVLAAMIAHLCSTVI